MYTLDNTGVVLYSLHTQQLCVFCYVYCNVSLKHELYARKLLRIPHTVAPTYQHSPFIKHTPRSYSFYLCLLFLNIHSFLFCLFFSLVFCTPLSIAHFVTCRRSWRRQRGGVIESKGVTLYVIIGSKLNYRKLEHTLIIILQ